MATGSVRPKRSLRRRLILGITLTAAVAAMGEALLLHLVWYGYEERLIRRVVTGELRRSMVVHEREPNLAYPNTDDLTLFVVSREPAVPGDTVPPHLLPLVPTAGDVPEDVFVRKIRGLDGIEHHVGVGHRGSLTYLLLFDASDHHERRDSLLWALAGIVLLLTVAVYSAARALAGRLLAGLSQLQQAVALGPGAAGFGRPDMDVEVSALAEALDDQRRQVAAALRKERAFAAAASHELRTPLTRIATGADVLLAQPALSESVNRRLRSIRESVDDLQRLLDVLLRVARWQPGSDESVDKHGGGTAGRPLGELVANCVARFEQEARLLGADITVTVESPLRDVPQAALLEVVLSNLLRNAIRHGRGSPVTVRGHQNLLEVEDAGPGIDEAALGRVFDPFWRGGSAGEGGGGPPGHGLGLTISERICAAAGWTLTIRSGVRRGTCARVDLGPLPPRIASRAAGADEPPA